MSQHLRNRCPCLQYSASNLYNTSQLSYIFLLRWHQIEKLQRLNFCKRSGSYSLFRFLSSSEEFCIVKWFQWWQFHLPLECGWLISSPTMYTSPYKILQFLMYWSLVPGLNPLCSNKNLSLYKISAHSMVRHSEVLVCFSVNFWNWPTHLFDVFMNSNLHHLLEFFLYCRSHISLVYCSQFFCSIVRNIRLLSHEPCCWVADCSLPCIYIEPFHTSVSASVCKHHWVWWWQSLVARSAFTWAIFCYAKVSLMRFFITFLFYFL